MMSVRISSAIQFEWVIERINETKCRNTQYFLMHQMCSELAKVSESRNYSQKEKETIMYLLQYRICRRRMDAYNI